MIETGESHVRDREKVGIRPNGQGEMGEGGTSRSASGGTSWQGHAVPINRPVDTRVPAIG